MTRPAALLAYAALAGASVLACGGSRPHGSFDGSVYRDDRIAFQLAPAPAQWRRIEVKDASVAFRDEAHDASILINARCLSADDRTPLVALTNHLLIGATERRFIAQETEPFDGREALHTKLEAKWDGVPMGIDVYVLSKDGCVYDFVYVGARHGFETGAPLFEQWTRGFRTMPGSGAVG